MKISENAQVSRDMAEIFEKKLVRRRRLAALPWEEKIAIVEKMRQAMPRGAWSEVEDGGK